MRYERFKEHKIQKTEGLEFADIKRYRPFLSKDFAGRCCYCNMHENTITSSFQIDHFIPTRVFAGKKDDLKTDYRNLMWACPKCNLAKSSKYDGDIMGSDRIENRLFYNPVDVDYDTIFFRNEFGAIDTEDAKGWEMIRSLKLYHPVHALAWLVEKLERTYGLLEKEIESTVDSERKKELERARDRIANIYIRKERALKAAYKNKFL